MVLGGAGDIFRAGFYAVTRVGKHSGAEYCDVTLRTASPRLSRVDGLTILPGVACLVLPAPHDCCQTLHHSGTKWTLGSLGWQDPFARAVWDSTAGVKLEQCLHLRIPFAS